MSTGIEARLARWLTAWVLAVRRHARAVLALALVVTAGLAVYTARCLRYNSDTVAMVGKQVESRKILDEYAALFPNLENALLVVVDAETPELARQASDALAERLRERRELFEDVYAPGGGSFFETYGLLYASVDELDRFADEIATLQPVIAELERDGSIANLSELVISGLEAAEEGGEGERWGDVLERIGSATLRVYDEFPVAISWEDLMLEGSALDVATRRVLILHPILDFSDMLAAGPARAAACERHA